MSTHRVIGCLCCILWLQSARAAEAQPTTSVYAGGAFEAFIAGDRPGHGAVLAGVGWRDEDWQTGLHLNTETLWWDGMRRLSDRWSLSGVVKGEALAAQVLADRYVDGALAERAALRSSYLHVGSGPSVRVSQRSTLRAELSATRWWLARLPATAAEYQLPDTRWIGRAALGWTWWRLRPDAGFRQEVRRRERLHGVAVGAFAGGSVRDRAGAWGDRNQMGRTALQQRPDLLTPEVAAWLRTGTAVGGRARLQWHQRVRWQPASDDLVRSRIGGLADPWVLPVSGQPWAVARSARYSHAMASLAVRAGARNHEVGLQLDGALYHDDDVADLRGIMGTSLFADLRWEHWQVDAQVGASPGRGEPRVSALFGFGWHSGSGR